MRAAIFKFQLWPLPTRNLLDWNSPDAPLSEVGATSFKMYGDESTNLISLSRCSEFCERYGTIPDELARSQRKIAITPYG